VQLHGRTLVYLGYLYLVPSDQLDMAVITRGKNDINTVCFLTQTARFVS